MTKYTPIVLLAFLIFFPQLHTLGSGNTQQEDAEAGEGQFDETSELKQSLDKELKRLQKMTRLSDGAANRLKRNLQPAIVAEYKRQQEQRASVSVTGRLSASFLLSVTRAAEKVVQNKALFKTYQDDVNQRVALEARVASDSFVQAVDAIVALSSKQRPKVKAVANKLHGADKINPMKFAYSRGDGMLAAFEQDLKGVFTEKQLQYFQRFSSETTSERFEPIQTDDESIAERKSQLTADLRMVSEMKVAQLQEEFDLNAKQKRKLELVTKSIITKVVPERIEAELVYGKYIVAVREQDDTVPLPNTKVLGLALTSVVDLFDNQRTRWDKYVTEALSDEQNNKWNALETQRQRAKAGASTYMLLLGLGNQLSLSGQQLTATYELLIKHMEPPKGSKLKGAGLVQSYRAMSEIPDADYKKAMGTANWQAFEPQLKEIKQDLRMMEKRMKDRE